MAKISYIDTGILDVQDNSFSIPTDESIGAILIDLSGFEKPFDGRPLLHESFKDGKVQKITNMDDASLVGIVNDGFLNGMLYYHLSQFFDYVGGDQVIYVMLADCSENWDSIQYLHQQISGREFQIGVWTSQPIWNRKEDGSIGFTSLITDLQLQANDINGELGKPTHSMTPINIVLCGNSAYIDGEDFSYKSLPDAVELNCPKVSVILAQNGSPEIKTMQSANPNNAPVSVLGILMACLSLLGAEESIASLEKCDLNKNEGFNYPQWGVGNNGTPIENVHRIWANIISEKGYIIPMDYDGEEASYYFSSDQTLTTGDFSSIANNRVMHKCRRALCTALLPHINGHFVYDPSTKSIDNSSITLITSAVHSVLDSIMKNKLGQDQINSKTLSFIQDDDLLETDSIALRLEIEPVNYSSAISEDVSHDITQ